MRRRGLACLPLLASFFLLAVFSSVCTAQETQTPPTISERLTNLKDNLQRLEEAWKQQKIALSEAVRLSNELQKELSEVRQSLETSQRSLDFSRLELAKSMTSLRQSETTLLELSTSFQAYQRTARRRIITGWLGGGAAGVVVGFITAIVLGLL